MYKREQTLSYARDVRSFHLLRETDFSQLRCKMLSLEYLFFCNIANLRKLERAL